jgi:parvulin-like peptidyl-prolyl isomerase
VVFSVALSGCTSLLGPPHTSTPAPPTVTAAPPSATPPPLAATVNGEGITRTEYEAELERYQAAQRALGRALPEDQARETVLQDLIAQTLLAQGARAAGYELTGPDLQSRAQALAGQAGGPDALARWQSEHGYSDESFLIALKRAAEAAWMRDRIIADVPAQAEQVHIQQILTYNEATAINVLAQLDDGANFDELAAIYDPNTRGELGWVPRGYLLDPAVEQAAFALEVGEHSQVIATPAGFHVILLLERDPLHVLSPDAQLRLQELALLGWLQAERQQSEIQIRP